MVIFNGDCLGTGEQYGLDTQVVQSVNYNL